MDDHEGQSLFSDINITPLADVLLVLVVILLVTSLAVHERCAKPAGIAVDASAHAAGTKRASLVIDVEPTDITIAGRAFDDDQLANLFRAAFQRDHDTPVILRADRSVPVGRVVTVMERARRAGLAHISIGTER